MAKNILPHCPPDGQAPTAAALVAQIEANNARIKKTLGKMAAGRAELAALKLPPTLAGRIASFLGGRR